MDKGTCTGAWRLSSHEVTSPAASLLPGDGFSPSGCLTPGSPRPPPPLPCQLPLGLLPRVRSAGNFVGQAPCPPLIQGPSALVQRLGHPWDRPSPCGGTVHRWKGRCLARLLAPHLSRACLSCICQCKRSLQQSADMHALNHSSRAPV